MKLIAFFKFSLFFSKWQPAVSLSVPPSHLETHSVWISVLSKHRTKDGSNVCYVVVHLLSWPISLFDLFTCTTSLGSARTKMCTNICDKVFCFIFSEWLSTGIAICTKIGRFFSQGAKCLVPVHCQTPLFESEMFDVNNTFLRKLHICICFYVVFCSKKGGGLPGSSGPLAPVLKHTRRFLFFKFHLCDTKAPMTSLMNFKRMIWQRTLDNTYLIVLISDQLCCQAENCLFSNQDRQRGGGTRRPYSG